MPSLFPLVRPADRGCATVPKFHCTLQHGYKFSSYDSAWLQAPTFKTLRVAGTTHALISLRDSGGHTRMLLKSDPVTDPGSAKGHSENTDSLVH